jgi:hypothetical protein
MITNSQIKSAKSAGVEQDCSFGNRLFRIAGIIGIATKKGYDFGFESWPNQEYFVNPLPKLTNPRLPKMKVKPNFAGFDFGFCGFNYPDNIDIDGEFGSELYFEHCKDLIRYYFEMKPICEPYKDCILVHYRDYGLSGWVKLDKSYYSKAIKQFPDKKIIVVTDNIDEAFKQTGIKGEYTSNTPIIDFYLLAHADYLVMANSTFSWWGAWLADCPAVAPKDWFTNKELPTSDLYCKNWKVL